ncbi:LacI family DNA-binding transcriptional regulator [Aurantimonas sp. C2-6-R+9]|uniref:LacI family DNA-binding transcriptional regulator n=1 Tax=unclassified Aurantimonas TaxID=2638230 RepID=UPI002E18B99C|nr:MULTISPECIES: LacI family DNA-binding transcriptional regulator [unclassified Aurantimonas]MEC5292599.1 LacI family DNA-binding transcriptional regulator [Aurantimonas sp. C2-3-R2]MEC5322134.1 LacI family DNA-binding transcriptional regulator [Aurantimonas sp. A3-2-R12]MEC5382802.1 LacI family DNA-binding transcriptional regulator [Aurantimonas sp. C2-6-R+9]MEC5413654.1 LacI family DNA-binding transcriptional regulator [Aurantimonas sp. C2-4-R8]
MAQKVKLSTIADSLGLSTATVSLALRDSPLVAEVTRERIKHAARDLGYIYNRRAASLRTSRSGILGVCVHDIMNPFFGEILKSVEDELDRRRQTFILCNHHDELAKQRSFVDTMLQLGADGLILSPAIGTPASDIHLAEENELPVTLIARTIEGSGVCGFRGDDSYGMGLAVDHLIGRGHRSIAMIGGTAMTSTGRDREAGYLAALTRGGIEFRDEWRIKGPRDRHSGFDAVSAFLAIENRPTAIVCFSDLVALGVMYGLSRAGLRPGVDVAVIGYDDIDEAVIATPSLTTVANGQSEVGRRAAGALLDRLQGQPANEETILITPELKIRQSSELAWPD